MAPDDAAPLTPLPEYVEEAVNEALESAYRLGRIEEENWTATVIPPSEVKAARAEDLGNAKALRAAIHRYAEEAARGAGERAPWLGDLHREALALVDDVRAGKLAKMVCDWLIDATPDPRPAGCVCPVERVVKALRSCTKHGERKP